MAYLSAGTGGKQLEPGQGTAIVTGAISIVFGVSGKHPVAAAVSIHSMELGTEGPSTGPAEILPGRQGT